MSAAPPLTRRMFRFLLVSPFRFTWWLVTGVCNAIGILLSLFFGIALVTLGYFLASTIIGAIIGVPMLILGIFLLLRALY